MKVADISVELVDVMGTDLSVCNAARVSFAKTSEYAYKEVSGKDAQGDFTEMIPVLKDGDKKLIHYLASHGHWSPFCHAFITFRLKAPVFVCRQLVKHQVGLSWNEESRRYIDEEPEFYLPKVWRAKPEGSIKQGSGDGEIAQYVFVEYGKNHPHCWGVDETASQVVETQTAMALEVYNALLYANVAPEQARMVLPLNTMTNWIWSGSLMAFARVCKQRLDPHSQAECRDVAKLMNDVAKQQFPYSWEALVGVADT